MLHHLAVQLVQLYSATFYNLQFAAAIELFYTCLSTRIISSAKYKYMFHEYNMFGFLVDSTSTFPVYTVIVTLFG